MTALGKVLRKLRIDYDEVLFDMAQKLGVSSSFLSGVENGKKSPPLDWADKLRKLYSLTDEQYTEIQDEIAASVKQIRIDLESSPKNKKDLAIAFGRRFEELEDQEIDSVLNVLRNRKERCEK